MEENVFDDDDDSAHQKKGTRTIGDGDEGKLFSLAHVYHYTILSTRCKHYLRGFLDFSCP